MTEPSDPANQPDIPTETTTPPPPEYAPQGYPQNYAPGPYPGAYPPPPPQPYAGYDAPMPTAPKNGFGIAALIVGLLSLPAILLFVLPGIALGIIAIILGIIGYRRAKSGEANNGGVAIGGIVLGILSIIVSAVLIAVGVWGFNKFGGQDLFECLRQAGNDTAAQQECQDQFRGSLEEHLSITLTPTP